MTETPLIHPAIRRIFDRDDPPSEEELKRVQPLIEQTITELRRDGFPELAVIFAELIQVYKLKTVAERIDKLIFLLDQVRSLSARRANRLN